MYHQQDCSEISDSDYDKLRRELKEIESLYPHFGSLDKSVGAPPLRNIFKTKPHLTQMLSLANCFSKGEFESFLKRTQEYLNCEENEVPLIAEPKIDGLSLSLRYQNGHLVGSRFILKKHKKIDLLTIQL